ncbi:Iduronate-2-sulfatase [Flagellimonas maritima]|uniref:Iduronate-2-sulfatase n=1 Tax=Flagellimonas maritima TaxID=1383885 RepID=A0A2Z4LPD6_9FLAO|nr:sulfatase [Allomuricauda aurantiaca]AWX43676.1 Iduronate-2-sulfatase [Allomuricauda aurantiaca]
MELKSKNFIALITLFIVVGCGFKSGKSLSLNSKSGTEANAEKQNILFIAIDDLRPMISSYGETQMVTPNIDRLASEGIQFNNAFTNIAVCGASRASIMTGIRPSYRRFNDYTSRASTDVPNAVTLNQLFKENGYETISYGKIYHHPDDNKEHWTEMDNGSKQNDYQDLNSIAKRLNGELGSHGKKGPVIEYPDVSDYSYNDGKVTKKAINKLRELKTSNKPFFMALGYVAPHLPFIQPKKYWDLYNHESIELAKNGYQPENAPYISMASQHYSSELRNMYLDIPKKGNLNDELSRNLVHGYYASVSYMDALIGEVIQSLDDLGLRENTTIVLWSDHGFFLGEHGMWCKHSTFYEAIKIPLIISSSKYKNNQTTQSMTELVDIYPTLCDIAQLDAPDYLHGMSLIPVLTNPEKILKTEIYTRYKEGEAVVDIDYSYTEFYRDGQYLGNMLYNLNTDSEQNTNISKEPSAAALVVKYKEKLKIMRDKVDKDPIQ